MINNLLLRKASENFNNSYVRDITFANGQTSDRPKQFFYCHPDYMENILVEICLRFFLSVTLNFWFDVNGLIWGFSFGVSYALMSCQTPK